MKAPRFIPVQIIRLTSIMIMRTTGRDLLKTWPQQLLQIRFKTNHHYFRKQFKVRPTPWGQLKSERLIKMSQFRVLLTNLVEDSIKTRPIKRSRTKARREITKKVILIPYLPPISLLSLGSMTIKQNRKK